MLGYSHHARRRMEQRDITEEEVQHAISHPTGPAQPANNGGIVIYGYAFGSRILKVVLSADKQVVISVMAVGEFDEE